MKRNKHSLSHYHLTTFDMGWLVPVANFEVLPGDSVRMSTSCLLRVSPLLKPVMHPVTVRLHHWFVPFRILWDDETGSWEDFITGGPDGTGYPLPKITIPSAGAHAPHTLLNYLGVPESSDLTGVQINVFPVRAYNRIYSEFYRDQDIMPEPGEDELTLQNIAWEKDIFTAARPWTQKGPEVTIPVVGSAPVMPELQEHHTAAANAAVKMRQVDGGGAALQGELGIDSAARMTMSATGFTGIEQVYPSNLYADLQSSSAISPNDLRLAMALQRYQEARAQYGSRYTEYLRYLGVRSSDARLQRPEYLGGGRATINFSEVLKTGEGDTPIDEAPVGEMRGHGISAMRSRRWIRFFEEHGIVMTLASIRPRSMYMDGLPRSWRKNVKEDYWTKELELIGQQEVDNTEVYSGAAPGVFGYNDRYYEYRHHPSYVSSEFQTTESDWHMARSFAAPPALNGSFVQCQPTKRIHAVQDTSNTIWGMFSHSIQARRLVGKKTIGRIF